MYVIVFNIVFFRVQVNETIKSYLFWLFISLFICWLIVQWIMRIIHQMVTKNMCDFSMPWNGNQIYEVVKERKNNRMNRWIRETLSLNYHKNIQPKWMAIETHSSQRGELNNYSFFLLFAAIVIFVVVEDGFVQQFAYITAHLHSLCVCVSIQSDIVCSLNFPFVLFLFRRIFFPIVFTFFLSKTNYSQTHLLLLLLSFVVVCCCNLIRKLFECRVHYRYRCVYGVRGAAFIVYKHSDALQSVFLYDYTSFS